MPVVNIIIEFYSINTTLIILKKQECDDFMIQNKKNFCPSINLDGISNYIEKSNLAQSDTIDITRWGFFKLLGKGKIPSKPLIIKAKIFSKKAQTKIIKSGGICVLIP